MAIAGILYAMVLPWVWNTMGDPLRRAVIELEELQKTKTVDDPPAHWGSTRDDLWDDDEGFDDFVDEDEDVSGYDFNDEEKDEQEEEDEDDEYRPLPNWFLPDAGAAAAFSCLVSATILFQLMCRWFVSFKARTLFNSCATISKDCFLHIKPYAHHGKEEIVPISKDDKTQDWVFEFQRQKFTIARNVPIEQVKLMGLENASNEKVDSEEEELALQKLSDREVEALKLLTTTRIDALGVAFPIVCKVDLPMSSYVQSRGLNKKQVQDHTHRYGTNLLAIRMKGISDLMKEGLLSPIAIFQFFSAGLWLLDEYWQFSIFNIFIVFMMEGMTAFQRSRTLKTLKGLAPDPYKLPVYRGRQWITLDTTQLLPGDLISLASLVQTEETTATGAKKKVKKGTDSIPCDCLILHGSAVVNEATLTGESVPQMKDSLKMTSFKNMEDPLEFQGRNRVNVMFSGTSLVSASVGEDSKDFPKTPDNGCLCYVLRTGFSSSQGELMQMIEFSTEKVSADARETGLALFILFCFAMVSATYVFNEGLKKGDRTTHELMLKCVMILTSVVPTQLPVQMAVSVNHALMALNKQGLFCTEPYRVPFSGKITH